MNGRYQLQLLLVQLGLFVQGQFYLPDECFATFRSAALTLNLDNTNTNKFTCPTTCFTRRYLSNQQEYPLFGNASYSEDSLICKAAYHDGRVMPWNTTGSTLSIRNNLTQSRTFTSSLRNGILSGKSTTVAYFAYQFLGDRINETSIPDIAIEHRQFLYSQDQPSSITCRSKADLQLIQPVEMDHGWKRWPENRLKYFSTPRNFTRADALSFCTKNNGSLMYWSNSTEQSILQGEVLNTTLYRLFQYQRRVSGSNQLTFFIGLKQTGGNKQWESNVIAYNESLQITPNSSSNEGDYCTYMQSNGANPQSVSIVAHQCDDSSVRAYPLCRLLPSASNDASELIYRMETDDVAKPLTGVIDFCMDLGGYPIYAHNAYEWQLIQEILLKDPAVTSEYVYTSLISNSKQVTDAHWEPMDIPYDSSLDFIAFAPFRSPDRTGFHLSRAADESYYYLYDINPDTVLSRLRFCRKADARSLMRDAPCDYKSCRSNCHNVSLPSQSDDARFGFYACAPRDSLAGIVYTHAFPVVGDFHRADLPMEYGVALRRSATPSLALSFRQVNSSLSSSSCVEYLNFDRTTSTSESIALSCNSPTTGNLSMSGVQLKRDYNGLITLALRDRRMPGHHLRYIDYPLYDSRCSSQGIFHPYVNQCICAPGFYDDQCQSSCPAGYYGQTCDFHCQGDDDYCKALLICLPDPYGCSCYTGWYGTYCNISCPSDRYGPDCAYQCPCANCNRFSGICDCEGTECYKGIYTRQQLQSPCSSSSLSPATNLALVIVLPIIGVLVLITIVAVVLYWKLVRARTTGTARVASPSPASPISDEHL